MRHPDLSFIIPVLNGEAYVAEAIGSCLSQTHKSIEVIVIDDGSTDYTPKILEWYKGHDPRVRVITLASRMGAAEARNFGCQEAQAPFLALLDSDDVSDKDRARISLDYLRKETCLFHSAAAMMDVAGRITGDVPALRFDLESAFKHKVTGIVHSSVAYPKTLWEKFPFTGGDWQECGLEDWKQQMEMALAGVKFVPYAEALCAYRVREASVSAVRNEVKTAALKAEFLEVYGPKAEAATV